MSPAGSGRKGCTLPVMRTEPPDDPGEPLGFADVAMDLAAYKVRRAGRLVHLGPTEYRVLRYLLEHPRRVFTREELLAAVWHNGTPVDARTVDAHILRLRRALNIDGSPDLIRTVRSIGYALDTEVG